MDDSQYEDPSLFNNKIISLKISLRLRELVTDLIKGEYDGHMHKININDEDMDDDTKLTKKIIEKIKTVGNIPKVIVLQYDGWHDKVEVEVEKIDSNFRPHRTKSKSGSRLKKVKKNKSKSVKRSRKPRRQ